MITSLEGKNDWVCLGRLCTEPGVYCWTNVGRLINEYLNKATTYCVYIFGLGQRGY